MARPKKPPIGTPERLDMDLGECWPIYRFMEQRIKNDPRKAGRILRAQDAAMKKFRCSRTKVKRHYDLIVTSIETGAMARWKVQSIKSVVSAYLPDAEDMLQTIDRAFTAQEQNALEPVGVPLVYEFAQLRLQSRKKRK